MDKGGSAPGTFARNALKSWAQPAERPEPGEPAPPSARFSRHRRRL